MPVAFVFEPDQADQSSYDALMKAIGRESIDAPHPPGHIVHLAGPRPGGGWRAIDLWESEEAASAFYSSEQFGVKGHRDFPVGGQLISLWADRLTPWSRSADLLAGQVSGVTPFPAVASARRRLVPSVRTRCA